MTIKELKDKIELLDEESIVIIASDEEGNSFHELQEIEVAKYYQSDGEWEIDLIDEEDTEDYEDLKEGLVLWP